MDARSKLRAVGVEATAWYPCAAVVRRVRRRRARLTTEHLNHHKCPEPSMRRQHEQEVQDSPRSGGLEDVFGGRVVGHGLRASGVAPIQRRLLRDRHPTGTNITVRSDGIPTSVVDRGLAHNVRLFRDCRSDDTQTATVRQRGRTAHVEDA